MYTRKLCLTKMLSSDLTVRPETYLESLLTPDHTDYKLALNYLGEMGVPLDVLEETILQPGLGQNDVRAVVSDLAHIFSDLAKQKKELPTMEKGFASAAKCVEVIRRPYSEIPRDIRFHEMEFWVHTNRAAASSGHLLWMEHDGYEFIQDNFSLAVCGGHDIWSAVLTGLADSKENNCFDKENRPSWGLVRTLQGFNRTLELTLHVVRKIIDFGWVEQEDLTGRIQLTEQGRAKVEVVRESRRRSDEYALAEERAHEGWR